MHHLCFGVLLGVALFAVPAQARGSLGDAFNAVGQQYADQYARPVTGALGANLNAGLFRTAEVGGDGILPVIDIHVGVMGMGALIAGSSSSFAPRTRQLPPTTGAPSRSVTSPIRSRLSSAKRPRRDR